MEEFEKLLNFSLINIDKSSGPTSFSVSEFVKKKLKLSKTSHMGTLDPRVTGVLPVTLGRACKLAGHFIKHDKTYVGVMHTHKEQDMEKLQEIIDKDFSGKIKQTPPNRSAVKREEREREVYSFKFLEASNEDDTTEQTGVPLGRGKDFLFECKVEGGTYIRKICSDLGEQIGGAHMAELRRTEAGIFDESTLVKLEDFENAVEEYKKGNNKELKKMLMPAEKAIKKVLPSLQVEKRALKALHNGKPLFAHDVISKEGEVLDLKEKDSFSAFCGKRFVGIYRKTGEEIIFGRAEFVYN